MTAALVVLFAGLTVGTFGYDLLRRYATDVVANQWVALALTLLVSGAALFAFLQSAYYRLPNARLTHREVLPGAMLGAVVLVGTLQALPLFVSLSSGRRRAAGARHDVPAPRVALRDGERDRVRRGAQLRARLRRHGPRGRAEACRRDSRQGARRTRELPAPRGRGASARASRRRRAPRPSASRPRGRTPGRSRTPRSPEASRAMRPSSVPSATSSRPSGAIATITQT